LDSQLISMPVARVARRVCGAVVVLWGALTLLFLVFYVLPGDTVDVVVGSDRVVTPETRALISRQLGLDQSMWAQYVHYWSHLLRGDFGTSFVNGRSVNTMMAETVPASLRLAFWAVCIEFVVGGLVGVWSATSRFRGVRSGAMVWAAALMALPVVALGLLLQLLFSVVPFQQHWPDWTRFPVQGIGPDHWYLWVIPASDQWRHVLLPALTLAAVSTALTSRLTNASLSEVLRRDFVRGALAKGVSPRAARWRHGVRNALAPVVVFVALDVASLFGSAVVTERVFNWPGLGSEVADALVRRDIPVVLAAAFVTGVAYVVVNLIADVLHVLLDPRLRKDAA
jgi:ABC-type dipeptide/oligopeptide/nickel transport system permease component